MVELPDPVIEVGLKDTVSPLPSPEADSAMAELKPPVAVVVIVAEPDELSAMVNEVGDAETLKVAAVFK